MSSVLYVCDLDLKNKDFLLKSINCKYLLNSLGHYKDVNRIGLLWNNQYKKIPFGFSEYVVNKKDSFDDNNEKNQLTLHYFSKELVDFFVFYNNHNKNVIIDFITCNLNSPLFIKELEIVKNLCPSLQFNYSTNKTGSTNNSDWIMESNGENIKNVYFNNNINDYNDELVDPNFGFGIWKLVNDTYYLDTDNVKLTSWKSAIDLSSFGGKTFDGNNHLITFDMNDLSRPLFTHTTNNMITLVNFNIVVNGNINEAPLYSPGYVFNSARIYNCNSTINGNVNNSGGLLGNCVGYNGICSVEKCNTIINGNINQYSGGLCGYNVAMYNSFVSINDCSVTINGNINGVFAGGVIGDLTYQGGNIMITNTYVSVSGNVINGASLLVGGNNVNSPGNIYTITINNSYGLIYGMIDNSSYGYINYNPEITTLLGNKNCGILDINNNNQNANIINGAKQLNDFKFYKLTEFIDFNQNVLDHVKNINKNIFESKSFIKFIFLKYLNGSNYRNFYDSNMVTGFNSDDFKNSLNFVKTNDNVINLPLTKLGFSYVDMILGGFKKLQFEQKNITLSDLFTEDIGIRLLNKLNYTLSDYKQFTSFYNILFSRSFNYNDLINVGFTKNDVYNVLNEVVSYKLLDKQNVFNLNFTKEEYLSKNLNIAALYNYGFNYDMIKNIGFESKNILVKNCVWDFYRYTKQELKYPNTSYDKPNSWTNRSTMLNYVSENSVSVNAGYYTQPRYIISFDNIDGKLMNFSVKLFENDISSWESVGIVITQNPNIQVSYNNNVVSDIQIDFSVLVNGYAYRNLTDIYRLV